MRNFRGQRLDNQGWVYGDRVKIGKEVYICNQDVVPIEIFYYDKPNGERINLISSLLAGLIEVDPKTVGQSTGETTKDGTEVYAMDFVDSGNKDCCWKYGLVMHRNSAFRVHAFCLFELIDAGCKVVGNSIDNPTLTGD